MIVTCFGWNIAKIVYNLLNGKDFVDFLINYFLCGVLKDGRIV